ncbi:hypothetical protein C1701_24785 [Actinoalloteichus sp. AHMU CJ021]|uniref:CapA family protein n=1 Tax=Actinoalloteichus sp. AHMU CJ021 TaxID=2072503 RepID=UPI000CA06126|nr:hypothetical protein C1701_24785 [Actinoalloteichus sp. AHMU CJ021]
MTPAHHPHPGHDRDSAARRGPPVTLFLAGDVMTGRGVDQLLPGAGAPEIREDWLRDARDYLRLAEAAHGPLPAPAPHDWPWGDLLALLTELRPAARLINLETSVTRADTFDPAKALHYRMSPDNLPVLTALAPDVCTLANNHVLDLGHPGLLDTLRALTDAGLPTVGAGTDADHAARPHRILLPGGNSLAVLGCATPDSGVPATWAANPARPGVHLIPDLSPTAAHTLAARLAPARRAGATTAVSVHWGGNWGYTVPPAQVDFAHHLIDGGVDLVHGHSSHHPRAWEVYRGHLVLYGCGDLINDYEGITGHDSYRPDLRAAYLPDLDPDSGRLLRLRVAVLRSERLRLRLASHADRDHVRRALDDTGPPGRERLVHDGGLLSGPA